MKRLTDRTNPAQPKRRQAAPHTMTALNCAGATIAMENTGDRRINAENHLPLRRAMSYLSPSKELTFLKVEYGLIKRCDRFNLNHLT